MWLSQTLKLENGLHVELMGNWMIACSIHEASDNIIFACFINLLHCHKMRMILNLQRSVMHKEYTVRQRCADMYPRIDILRISVIFTDTDMIRIVISMFERIRIRIRLLCHGYSTDTHYVTSAFYFMFYFQFYSPLSILM